MHLSVVIPAYNEAKRISATLLDIDKYLSKQKYSYEIIVVSDGSSDNTVDVVRKLKELVKNLKIVDNKENHGKGYVVKQGMLKEASGNYRLFMDADNSTSIDHLEKFWSYIKNDYDIVIGSIEVKGAKIKENALAYRRFLGRISKYIIRIFAGIWNIKDSQRGFKLFTEDCVKKVFPKQSLMRWGFDFEILAISKKMGFKIKEVPVDWKNAGESKVKFSAYFRTFGELMKIRWNFITNKYNID
ncbi:MAG: glycosyltransferase [Candidatus Portnoybacteria bacterium]|nr:glycosyltransferase [Candidatus Portnoybacteria bacterium]